MKSNRLILSIIALSACISSALGATRMLPAAPVTAIVATEAVSIQYVVGPVQPIVITGSDYAMATIDAKVTGGMLQIRRKAPEGEASQQGEVEIDGVKFPSREEAYINVTVSAPEVSTFRIGAWSKLVCTGAIDLHTPFMFVGGAYAVGVFGDITASSVLVKTDSFNGIRMGRVNTYGDFNLSSEGFDIINVGEVKAGKSFVARLAHDSNLTVEDDVISGLVTMNLQNSSKLNVQKWFATEPVNIKVSEDAIFRAGFTSGPSLLLSVGVNGEATVADCANRAITISGASGSSISLSNIDAESVMATTDSGQIVLTGHADFGAVTSKNGQISQSEFHIGDSLEN